MSETETWEDQCEHEQKGRLHEPGEKWLSLTLTVG